MFSKLIECVQKYVLECVQKYLNVFKKFECVQEYLNVFKDIWMCSKIFECVQKYLNIYIKDSNADLTVGNWESKIDP